MFFSVIVPVFNVEPYLRQCLDSLVSQTCLDMEIIIVDDGSTDASGEICDEYAEKYSCISVIHQENQGLSAARNVGMARSTGEWISFVDSDDWVDEDLLESFLGHILAAHADLYRFNCKWFSEEGIERDWILSENDAIRVFHDEEDRFNFYFEHFMKLAGPVWGAVYRRSIIEQHSITFADTWIVEAEDALFIFQYLLYAQKAVFLDETPYHYRLRAGSLTDNFNFEQRLSRISVLGEVAYQTVVSEGLSVFQYGFYKIYFQLLNGSILGMGADLDDGQIRRVLNELWAREFHRDCIKRIRKHGREFLGHTHGRVWYKRSFGTKSSLQMREVRKKLLSVFRRTPLAWRIWFFCQDVKFFFTRLPMPFYLYYRDREQKAAYLVNCKAACSSIQVSMLRKKDIPDDYSIFSARPVFVSKQPISGKEWFTFTFVRNPFERLVSCYESKYHEDITRNRLAKERGRLDFDDYLEGYLKIDKGFNHFVDQVVQIPWFLADRHFYSQYHHIIGKDGEPVVDFVGKVENLAEDYEPVRMKYGYDPLEFYNKVNYGDWRNYYTTRLAKKVYRKYKKDILYFGYEKVYEELLQYCAERNINSKRG